MGGRLCTGRTGGSLVGALEGSLAVSCPQVALRIRPLSDLELEDGATVVAHKAGDQVVVLMDPGEDPEDPLCTHRSREKTFIFDTVFDQQASQEDVYRATTQHLVEGVVSGYSSTMFAYGPSGAGKTHTMLGTDAEPGIYLQTLTHLLRAIEETRDSADCSVSTSYLEIYNEAIRDLLNPSSGFLDLREDARGSIQIAGITEVSTSNAQEIMQLLTKGNRQRTQEPTATNQTSSRSHAVLQVTVRQRSRATNLAGAVRLGRLFMVDLAGSERASQVPGLFVTVPPLVSICWLVHAQDTVPPRSAASPAPRPAPGPGEAPANRALAAGPRSQDSGRAPRVAGSRGTRHTETSCTQTCRWEPGASQGGREADV